MDEVNHVDLGFEANLAISPSHILIIIIICCTGPQITLYYTDMELQAEMYF